MARCEVAVRANLRFHTKPGFPALPFDEPGETVMIRFGGREFVWHPNNEPGPNGEEWWPGVTVPVADPDDYSDETEAMNRFLSALAFEFDQAVDILMYGGSSASDPLARPTPHYPRRGLADHVHEAPAEMVVTDDDMLRLALGLYREGLNAGSPFYRFLSFWNTIDAVFGGRQGSGRRDAFIDAEAPPIASYRELALPSGTRWSDHLEDGSRHAIAHVVRGDGQTVIDPDLPRDRFRLQSESILMQELARIAIEQRWPAGLARVPRSS